jgi:hypothetical protein
MGQEIAVFVCFRPFDSKIKLKGLILLVKI